MDNSLEGLTVVNTRPAHQADSLCNLIKQAGGALVEFPVIEIAPIKEPHELEVNIKKLYDADIAIFISANAVDAIFAISDRFESWPENVKIAAIGQATALKLESYGLTVGIKSSGSFNSEALLSLPEFENLTGKRIVIFRGDGGREFLADTLRSRDAEVEYIDCYRRLIPSSNPASLYKYLDEGQKLIIVVTSNEGLRNLVGMVNNEHQQKLLSSVLVVVSERAVALARELGFKQKPVLSSTVSNDAIIDAIKDWRSLN